MEGGNLTNEHRIGSYSGGKMMSWSLTQKADFFALKKRRVQLKSGNGNMKNENMVFC